MDGSSDIRRTIGVVISAAYHGHRFVALACHLSAERPVSRLTVQIVPERASHPLLRCRCVLIGSVVRFGGLLSGVPHLAVRQSSLADPDPRLANRHTATQQLPTKRIIVGGGWLQLACGCSRVPAIH